MSDSEVLTFSVRWMHPFSFALRPCMAGMRVPGQIGECDWVIGGRGPRVVLAMVQLGRLFDPLVDVPGVYLHAHA